MVGAWSLLVLAVVVALKSARWDAQQMVARTEEARVYKNRIGPDLLCVGHSCDSRLTPPVQPSEIRFAMNPPQLMTDSVG
jgi:hypothetical protein